MVRLSGRAALRLFRPAGRGCRPDRLNFARSALLRDVMLRHGDGGTSLWATAFGWNAARRRRLANRPGRAAGRLHLGGVRPHPRRQPWLGPLFWTGRFAPSRPPAGACGRIPLLPTSAARPPLPRPSRTGIPAGARPATAGSLAGRRLARVPFEGTGVALEVEGGPYWGYLTAAVDGTPANRLPRDEAARAISSCMIPPQPHA